MPERDPNVRITRLCDSCQQIDDHPHHGVYLADGTMVSKHLDCCMADGCPDGSCDTVLDGAGDKRGADLVEHLIQPDTRKK